MTHAALLYWYPIIYRQRKTVLNLFMVKQQTQVLNSKVTSQSNMQEKMGNRCNLLAAREQFAGHSAPV